MVAFSAVSLVPEDITEGNGSFYQPHRGRQTCRGADGRFYTGYTGVNGAGTAGIVRVVAWSANALGAITTHWDLKVSDIGFGNHVTDSEPPSSFALAIDSNAGTERLLVAVADYVGDLMRFFYISTGTPTSFTAGDTFALKEPIYTVTIGMDLFGRNGSGSIVLVYGNADDTDFGTTTVVVKSRTLSTHSGSWSSAADVVGAVQPYQGDVFFAATRIADGSLIHVLSNNGPGALTTGLVYAVASSPWTSWSNSKHLATVDNANYYVLSVAADASNNFHALVIETAGNSQNLRYIKYTSAVVTAENTVLHSIAFSNVVSLPSTFVYRFYRSGSITVDQDGNPHIVAALRANPVGFGTSPSNGYLDGVSMYYRKIGGTFAQHVVTTRKAQTDPQGNEVITVNSQSMPHDACVVGKMGYPAAGAMWVEVACHNQTIGGTGIPSCAAPGVVRRVVMTDDWEPGLTRRGRNAMGQTNSHTLAGPKPKSALNLVAFSQGATHPGSTFPRTGANAMVINGAASGGKGKSGANTMVLAQVIAVVVDYLTKWTGTNALALAQSATHTRVITRAAMNFIVLDDGFGQAFQNYNEIEFTQSAVASGSLRVFAGNSIAFTQGSVHDPIETCESNYDPAVAIPSNTESVVSVTLSAPASGPQKTLVLRRPDLDDQFSLIMQGEIARAQSGLLTSAIRAPNPVEWAHTFSGLSRKQVIEFEDFLVAWRAKSMLYRDANGWRWLVYILTTKPVFTSAGPESSFVTLEFSGTLIVE